MSGGVLVGVVSVMLAVSCTPALEDDASRADEPRVLAVRAEPAEARPGESVTLTALATDGTSVAWSLCLARKALAESGPIANECLVYPESSVALGGGPSVRAELPRDACRNFGPDPPLGTNGRPADPDGTGGYYQPGLAAGAAFSIRVRCGLAGATQAQVAEFESRYRINENPEIAHVLADGVLTTGALRARPGARLRLRVTWPASAAEPYVAFDPAARTVVDRRESLRVSWLATAGTFATSRTGVDEADPATQSENDFTVAGDATLYFVLRDSRGGVAFRALRVIVD
ncbi:MAG: hypothetical protein KIT84_30165 [Labilithrix sp.]|nr:hypothetical protein [Labilithrix sp.]MCW5815330.1 hypothetical protein [Labilithrix sp.]